MSLTVSILLFVISTVVIAVAGTKLTRAADQLADLTGWGEAVFGAIFLGGVTSLPGIVTSVVAAYSNHPELAISNAVGGIAAQTTFLAIADITYRKVNLEHAAASFPNLMQGLLLICLLAVTLVGIAGAEVAIFHISPLSVLLVVLYIAGSKLISKAREKPMWKPQITKGTVEDVATDENKRLDFKKVVLTFVILALIVAAAGYAVAKTGISIAQNTGLSESFVGTLLTAIATSLPELIVSIAAVKQRSLTLAVGNIIGGNSFDVLFIAFADLAYFKGSILHAITDSQIFIIALTMLMIGVLILGLLHRQEKGLGKIGWESLAILLLYVFGNAFLFFS